MCFFLGGPISSVVALQTVLASPSPVRLCLAAITLSTRLCPATFGPCNNLLMFIAMTQVCYRYIESTISTAIGATEKQLQLILDDDDDDDRTAKFDDDLLSCRSRPIVAQEQGFLTKTFYILDDDEDDDCNDVRAVVSLQSSTSAAAELLISQAASDDTRLQW